MKKKWSLVWSGNDKKWQKSSHVWNGIYFRDEKKKKKKKKKNKSCLEWELRWNDQNEVMFHYGNPVPEGKM